MVTMLTAAIGVFGLSAIDLGSVLGGASAFWVLWRTQHLEECGHDEGGA